MTKAMDIIIKWIYYLIFFLVPLVFFSGSFELFEYNKMMLTYALTVIIASAWLIKLIAFNGFHISYFFKSIRRTPLDIPILLYLTAHILSTIFSIDPHVSIWGYYSRFHEGLLATISYIILYYAAVSNLNRKDIFRIIYSSFISGLIVSLWGIGEHFGGSFSCLFITGKFDDSCWVQDVKGRVFATLGQPNWMAAYLDVLILTALGFIFRIKQHVSSLNSKKNSIPAALKSYTTHNTLYVILIALYFVALLFTKSRSGLLGLLIGLAVFAVVLLYNWWREKRFTLIKEGVTLIGVLIFVALLFGIPVGRLESLSLEHFLTQKQSVTSNQAPVASNPEYIDIGISGSDQIREVVWKGAVKVWQRYPIFGSGVETFAYAYYLDRPVAHNMLSEWDFLYNKAHNEFLNILATTGTVGFVTYLSLLGIFSWWFINHLRSTSNQQPVTNNRLISALFAAYTSILVTNFFGFSVVVIGLFFFLIPAFSYILEKDDLPSPVTGPKPSGISFWLVTGVIFLIALFMELNLANMWSADKDYAYGKNLDSVNGFIQAYPYLQSAISKNPDEPTFLDEESYNDSVLATVLYQQIQTSSSSALANLTPDQKMNLQSPQLGVSTNDLINKSVTDSDKVISISPNDMPFWKTRTKVFYTLATIDKKYILTALAAIQKAEELAPTDAKVHYNLGLLYGQAGDIAAAIKTFEETVTMKPDYADAHYALGLYYAQVGEKDKARAQMEFMLQHIGNDDRATKWLEDNK